MQAIFHGLGIRGRQHRVDSHTSSVPIAREISAASLPGALTTLNSRRDVEGPLARRYLVQNVGGIYVSERIQVVRKLILPHVESVVAVGVKAHEFDVHGERGVEALQGTKGGREAEVAALAAAPPQLLLRPCQELERVPPSQRIALRLVQALLLLMVRVTKRLRAGQASEAGARPQQRRKQRRLPAARHPRGSGATGSIGRRLRLQPALRAHAAAVPHTYIRARDVELTAGQLPRQARRAGAGGGGRRRRSRVGQRANERRNHRDDDTHRIIRSIIMNEE
eukprot:scaffold527_cov368-Prasinococcus_capsulatus_cf.AAC.47